MANGLAPRQDDRQVRHENYRHSDIRLHKPKLCFAFRAGYAELASPARISQMHQNQKETQEVLPDFKAQLYEPCDSTEAGCLGGLGIRRVKHSARARRTLPDSRAAGLTSAWWWRADVPISFSWMEIRSATSEYLKGRSGFSWWP